jgi:3-hydroxy-9,10-secoandrosta-1,3,5(10)-triene-9,17-dione monooxygenase reductase component
MDLEKFKAGLSRFGSGVTIITTREGDGVPAGFTANSFTSLSLSPPMVLFCLDREATCFDAFYGSTTFGVNILNSEQEEISNRFARRGGNKFQNLTLLNGDTGVPLIAGCLANLECRTTQTIPGGDHLIFLGEVQEVHLGEGNPLFYFKGSYHSL